MEFTVFPAIDLRGGQCVRLRQGLAAEETVYGADPLAMARRWIDAGATWLHVVDLDGAFGGTPAQADLILRLAADVTVPVQVGGGIRSADTIRRYLEAGVRRVVIGTRACQEPERLAAWAAEFGPRLAVGLDARDGWVQVAGWTETTSRRAVDLARLAAAAGIRTVIYTDTARDGMLTGVNTEALRAICAAADCTVIASGGVGAATDIHTLRSLACPNLAGVIVGKALYDGRATLPDLLAAARAPLS
ncbi:MAG: 1-(5-phosphoribosyl)-5-[(5-phosphoribosylamino)methylideneamino]imidazole-4-carboxamide isomerase [Candidatus Marinimicrobia bacterium]|nr:1-(5-phosphoribosyl)-5-[(5-phosphoribosylamino)methylideneamino]imidazole-4-carboxamide isomerase [Candidatus Neomarinimicrobiota bacterium]